jgi:hypothetical protein
MADLWHHVVLSTATEELERPRRFTRARWRTRPTRVARAATFVACIWSGVALVMNVPWGMAAGLLGAVWLLARLARSRRQCLLAVGGLVARAAVRSGLTDGSAHATEAPPEVPRVKAATKRSSRQQALADA